jgi:hypothetical protein
VAVISPPKALRVVGAGNAGVSVGFAFSLAAAFGVSLPLHPIPIEAILITKTNERKRKMHFFMQLYLLSGLFWRFHGIYLMKSRYHKMLG